MTESGTRTEGALGWDANFKLSWDILEYSIKDTDGIKSNVRTNESGSKFLTGFSLSIPPASAEEALVIATEKGNRVADYLGSIHCLPVQAFLLNITEIRPKGEVKTGMATTSFSANIHQPMDLDFSNIKKLLACCDPKVLRQLAHYNFGLRYSSDPINQFREFYLVLEDKYGKGHQHLKKYSYIRHALNHPELNVPQFAKLLLDEIGVSHLDPSSPEAKNLVQMNLSDLKQDARQIIADILKTI
ncbi:Uncharacterised protein [uncultured archaeon]|nr:Uncharacterised protein [uncultured archaeon]